MTDKEVPDLSPDNIARAVMMLFGRMADSKPFWCFVAVKPSRKDELAEKVKNKTLDITRYVEDGFGEIIVSGESAMPPRDVMKDLSAMFNIPIRKLFSDFDFDAEIRNEIEKLKKELGEA